MSLLRGILELTWEPGAPGLAVWQGPACEKRARLPARAREVPVNSRRVYKC